MEYVLVFILAFLAGGWAVTAGVLLDLNPVGVWISASLGSLMFLAIALTAGGWLRDLLVRRLGGEDAEASVRERAGPMVERWGTAGFGLIGPVVIGPIVGFGLLAFAVDLLRG